MSGDAVMQTSDAFWMGDIRCGRPIPIHAVRWRDDDAMADELSTASGDTGAGVPR
jgi:hypothetical protein